MRRRVTVATVVAVMVAAVMVVMAGSADAQQTVTAAEVMQRNTSVPFTKNMGQWPDSILFRADAGGAVLWFTNDGVYYQLTRRIATDDAGIDQDDPFGPRRMPGRRDMARDSVETLMFKAQFEGSNPDAQVIGLDEMEYKCNYFLGNDPARWRSNVPNYRSIVMQGVYPGVDVHFEGSDRGRLVYRYELAPGAQTSQVQVGYAGVEHVVSQEDGGVVADTRFGEIAGVLAVPGVGSRTSASVERDATDTGADGLLAGGTIDAENVDLVYSTYLGSGWGVDVVVDTLGCAYVIGTCIGIFPVQDAYDSDFNGGQRDAFVTKFSASGNGLVYSTYFGGGSSDWGGGIALDDLGRTYLTGATYSTDLLVLNAYDSTHNGDRDAFVARLSSSGQLLDYSTYVGGSNEDASIGIAVDGSGCAYVAGRTSSTDLPVYDAFDATFNGGPVRLQTKWTSYRCKLSHTLAARNSLLIRSFSTLHRS